MAVVEGGTGLPTVDSNLSFGLVTVAGTAFYLPRLVALDLSGANPKDVGMAVALAVPGATGRVVAGKVSGQGLTTSDALLPIGGKTSGNTALHFAAGANGELLTTATYGTATGSGVTVATTATTLLAANANRRSFKIFAPTGAVNVFVKFGSGATTSDYTFVLAAGQLYDELMPCYTGAITAVVSSGTQAVRVTEGT